MAPRTDTAPTVASEGVEIAQGVLFSEKLWSRLGAKARDMQKQQRRERMGDTSEVPDAPTAVFNHHFARDATWKQRELSLRKAYVEHLENLTLQKDDEKEALHKDMMQQVAGVYRLHEQVAAQRVAAHTKELQGKTMQRTSASPGHPAKCQLESEAALQCYASNPKNLLACRKMVDALERCAELARQQAVAALPSPK